MHSSSPTTAGIPAVKADLAAILSGTGSPEQLKTLIRLCHAMAKVWLCRKANAGMLSDLHCLDRNDLAFDCIADLFSRDGAGTYLQLSTYFSAYDLASLSEEDILFHLRRLVSSNVEHSIYRLFQEADPSLSKILRNVKLSIRTLRHFVETERFGEAYIAPAFCDTLEHLSPVEMATLEQRLLEIAGTTEFIPELLARLARLLREQQEHSRLVPTMKVAGLIRSLYEKKRGLLPAEESAFIDDTSIDAKAAVDLSCQEIYLYGRRSYVDRGKLPEQTLAIYCKVIHEGLWKTLVMNDGEDFTLYGAIRTYMPLLTEIEYKQQHKAKLEYLLRLARRRAVKKLA